MKRVAQQLQLAIAIMHARPISAPESPFVTGNAHQIGTSEIRLHTLVSIRDMLNAADVWRRLDQTTTAQNCFFQSYDWCKNWVEHHGGASHLPVIFMVMRGDQAITILPMMLVKVWGFVSVLKPLGEPHTQYAGVLTPDGKN